PSFPFFLSLIYRFVTDDLAQVRLTLVILQLIFIPLLYYSARTWGLSISASIAAAALWFTFQNTQTHLFKLGAEILAAILALVCLRVMIEKDKPNSKLRNAFGGLVAGLAALTRGYLLPLIPLLGLWLWYRRGWRAATAFVLPAIVVLGLWCVRNQARLGVFSLSTEGWQTVWQGNSQFSERGTWPQDWEPQRQYLNQHYPGFDQMNEIERDRVFRQAAINEIKAHPERFLKAIPYRLFAFLQPRLGLVASNLPGNRDYGYALSLLLAPFGAMLWLKHKRYADLFMLLLPLIAAAMTCAIIFGNRRFRAPGEFALAILAAVAIEQAVKQRVVQTIFSRLLHRTRSIMLVLQ
ncbi:MAG TPA: hypothetical protein VEF04_17595, partial [Blastocatellia bacterium]|nr:hypothetical protein [Blastocatellia bacterium]